MEFQLVITKYDNVYCCRVEDKVRKIYITETSFNKERAVRKVLERLYIKLYCQGIDPNSVTINKIYGDEV